MKLEGRQSSIQGRDPLLIIKGFKIVNYSKARSIQKKLLKKREAIIILSFIFTTI
jgi:hypothetical protein